MTEERAGEYLPYHTKPHWRNSGARFGGGATRGISAIDCGSSLFGEKYGYLMEEASTSASERGEASEH